MIYLIPGYPVWRYPRCLVYQFLCGNNVITSPLSCCLRNVTTSVQCTYIPVSDLHDVFGVHQWLIQLGSVLLALALARHEATPFMRTGHSVPL